jgi:hypothetical protein
VSGYLAIELATGYVIQHGEDGCTVSAYGQLGELFVGDAAIAVTKSCEDGAYVELVPLSNTGDAPVAWRIPGVDVAAAPSAQVEVWDPSVANIEETTYLVSVVVEGETRFLLGSGAEMEQLPVSGIGVSFRPVDVRSGL